MTRTTRRMVGTLLVLAGATGVLFVLVPDGEPPRSQGASGAAISEPEAPLVESENADASEPIETRAAGVGIIESEMGDDSFEEELEELAWCGEEARSDEEASDGEDWCQSDDE